MTDIGTRLRDMRQARSLTQDDVARMAGVTQNTVHRVEAGKGQPQIATINRIARLFGATVALVIIEGDQGASG